jgi:hypothetical protein
MQRLGKGKYVVLIISDKYLKSPNCMFELLQIAQNGDFYDRIFPLIMENAKIFKPDDRLNYVHFWENEISGLEEKIRQGNLTNLHGIIDDDLNLYSKIRQNIAQLMTTLKNINAFTIKMHRESSYKELCHAILEKNEEDMQVPVSEKESSNKAGLTSISRDRIKDIYAHLRREYELLSKYETRRDLSPDPKEVMRCKIEIEKIKQKIQEYEKQLAKQ